MAQTYCSSDTNISMYSLKELAILAKCSLSLRGRRWRKGRIEEQKREFGAACVYLREEGGGWN
jgi:hypothetical protein